MAAPILLWGKFGRWDSLVPAFSPARVLQALDVLDSGDDRPGS
jgi:hypothetical protein